eukprot:gene15001-17199_t
MGSKLKPRHPIFTYMVSHFVTIEPVEVGFIDTRAANTVETMDAASVEEPHNILALSGVGASAEGPACFTDLEANQVFQPSDGDVARKRREKSEQFDTKLTHLFQPTSSSNGDSHSDSDGEHDEERAAVTELESDIISNDSTSYLGDEELSTHSEGEEVIFSTAEPSLEEGSIISSIQRDWDRPNSFDDQEDEMQLSEASEHSHDADHYYYYDRPEGSRVSGNSNSGGNNSYTESEFYVDRGDHTDDPFYYNNTWDGCCDDPAYDSDGETL